MKLFILRHGRAEGYRVDDASRQLVASGEADVRSVLTRQRAEVGQPQQIWHSGYVRARDTAAIAGDILGPSIPVQVTDKLVPEGRPQTVVDAVYASGLDSVLLVSHQPLVSSLLDTLCGPAGPEAHHMPTASLACVELEVAAAGLGELRWLVSP